MGRIVCCAVAAAFAFLSAFGGGCSKTSEVEVVGPRVLVFGIDGGTWDVAQELMKGGELPNLRRLYDGGVHGVLESRPPAISPVVWSTIFTGRPHAEHGVDSWKTSQSTYRKVKAIWDITSEAGLITHVFNVPSTWPPTEINGVLVSGFPLSGSTVGGNTGFVVTAKAVKAGKIPGCYQGGLETIAEEAARLETGAWSPYLEIPLPNRSSWRAAIRVKNLGDGKLYLSPCYRSDADMMMASPPEARALIDQHLGEPYIPEGPGWSKHAEPETPGYLAEHLVQVSRNQTEAVSMYADTPWRLLIYVDTLVDRVSHPYWAYMAPDNYDGLDSAKAAKWKDEVREAYRETDRQLGYLLEAIEGDVYVVIASDHGFQSSRQRDMFIGTHHMDGIFLVHGPGLAGADADRSYIEDIGPTVLYLLELPVARDMAGKVIPAVHEQLGRPVTLVDTYEGERKTGQIEPVDAKTWQQLKGMGYVDPDEPAPRAAQRKGKAGQ